MTKKTTTPTNSITTDTITSFRAQREAFVKRLTVLMQDQARIDEEKARLAEQATRIDEEKRLIEEALATDGGGTSDTGTSGLRTTRKAAARAGKVSTNGKPAKPTGAIMPAIWDFL